MSRKNKIVIRRNAANELSTRQVQILRLINEAPTKTPQEIADQLSMSLDTVRHHMVAARTKLGLEQSTSYQDTARTAKAREKL